MDVHVLQLGQGEGAAHGGEVQCLSPGHTARAARHRERVDHLDAVPGRRQHRPIVGQDMEGQRLQGIAGQDRRGLTEGLVAGRLAAPQIVVVHGREVVVDQRIGVYQLDGAGRAVQGLARDPERRPGRVDQERPHALAVAEHGIAHGLVQVRGRNARGR